jgi:hypothetical protein
MRENRGVGGGDRAAMMRSAIAPSATWLVTRLVHNASITSRSPDADVTMSVLTLLEDTRIAADYRNNGSAVSTTVCLCCDTVPSQL